MNIPSRVNPFGYDNSLPPGYTKAAFLESTGSQAIRVPAIIDTAVAVVSCAFSLERIYSNQHPWGINSLIGEGDYRTGLRIIEGNQSTGEYILRFMEPKTSWTQHAVYSAKLGEKIDVVVDYSQGKLYCGGELKFEFSKTALVFSGYCGVFGHYYNTNGSFTDRLRGRISHFSISANGKPQCDIVPALDSSGTPCMFDTVSKQTFYNAVTGAFIVGFDTVAQARKLVTLPDVTAETDETKKSLTISLPWEAQFASTGVPAVLQVATDRGWTITVQYREPEVATENIEADFLEGTGRQYINCAYTFTQQTGLYAKSFAVYGNRQAMGNIEVSVPCPRRVNYSPQSISAVWNRTQLDLLRPLPRSVIVEGWINWKNSKTARAVSELGEQIVDLEGISASKEITLFRGASNWYGRIFSAAISENGSIVHQYIPALNPEGQPGMYDTVSKVFKTNNGTDSFIVGFETTEKAALSLSKLPVTTDGTLTVSLPAAAEDTATLVPAAIDIATARGWTIITQYRED